MGIYNTYSLSYEKSNTHQFEVPRMLLDTADLEDYVLKSQDRYSTEYYVCMLHTTMLIVEASEASPALEM